MKMIECPDGDPRLSAFGLFSPPPTYDVSGFDKMNDLKEANWKKTKGKRKKNRHANEWGREEMDRERETMRK